MMRPSTAVTSRRGRRGEAMLVGRGFRQLSVDGTSIEAAAASSTSALLASAVEDDEEAKDSSSEIERNEQKIGFDDGSVLEESADNHSPSMSGTNELRNNERQDSAPEDEYSPDSNETPSPSPNQLHAWKQADLEDYR